LIYWGKVLKELAFETYLLKLNSLKERPIASFLPYPILDKQGIRFSRFFTPSNLQKGIRLISATGGSTNAALHIPVFAKIARIPLNLDEFGRIAESVPLIAKFRPSSPYHISDYHQVGGVATAMAAIRRYLDTSVPMAFGEVLEDALKGVHGPDGTILHSSENPLEKNGCLAILCGSLAPKGAMVKRE